MIKLKTINFIKSHKHWKELLMAPPYCLKIVEDANYYMLRHNQLESDFSQPICNECRGLVIDKNTLEPIALSFPRFYNYGQKEAAQIHWNSARVQEKIDGSKIMVFWDKYALDWKICTSGTLNAYDAEVGGQKFSFGSLFDRAVQTIHPEGMMFFKLALNKDKIYTFELVSPFTQVVIPYRQTELYLIGQRDRYTFLEEEPEIPYMPFKRPKFYEYHSLEECIAATSKMGSDEEGFVVVDKFWSRIKIKSLAYLEAHYLANNRCITDNRIFNIIMQGEEGEFLSYFPEYQPQFDEIKGRIAQWEVDCRAAIEDVMAHRFTERKELAAYVAQNYSDKSNIIFDFMDSIGRYLQIYLRKMTSNQREKFFNI